MTDPLAELAAEVAERYALDPADFADRVRRQLARRIARGRLPYKACGVCRRDLPARAFAERPDRPDGLRSVCRACAASRDQGRER
ncbi:hypothetical protein [Micromonospora sp. WMMD980]|uniref:hypothetical protein n=1 Tax=Micromonospora sp. WMMD980 TaxID=3016088 RepID=UPI002417A6DC|nr:hypothetical protein [Micromonospora sp. WMMD980]MDG4801707.1 hypothetical protein [Micromonospora sp. WMMD980]